MAKRAKKIAAGDWDSLFEAMGPDAPCEDWQLYLRRSRTVSEALAAVYGQRRVGERGNVLDRFSTPFYADLDAATAASWLNALTGEQRPTAQRVIAAIREKYGVR